MRQRLSIREHFWRGNAPLIQIVALQTCWRRLRAWQDSGLWDRLHRHMLDRLNLAGRIDWSRASLDASSVPAKRGATRRARTRPTAASPAPSATSSWIGEASL